MLTGLSPSTLPIPARDSVKKLLGSENDAKVLTTNATVVNGVLKETTMVPTIPTQQPQEKTTTTPTPTIPTPTTPTPTTPTTTTPTPTTTTPTPTTPTPTPTTTIPTTTTPTLPTTPTPAGPTNSTVVPHTTPNPTIAPVTSTPPPKNRNFDGPSFVGGIILCMGIIAIAFVAWKFYKARTERNYHTL
uniref:Uncharacterized protein n=1 Tax=Timema genevievae TaxID=629358 RepID=A0A7R9JMJ7_TIMGE|nr:unnamed protein product [Timema genevievae]